MRYLGRCLLISVIVSLLAFALPVSARLGLGSRLVFQVAIGDNWEVVMAEQLQGRRVELTNLTDHPAMDGYPALSPDGTRIAFVSDRDGKAELFVMDADGQNPTRLIPGEAYWPTWSPSGQQIAFSKREGSICYIYLTDKEGRNQTRLTEGGMPTWSPDGDRIVFAKGMKRTINDGEIFVMDADGGNPLRLTDNWGISDTLPSWSPDGSRIAFVSERGDTSKIYTMNADGTDQRKLTASMDRGVWEASPCWSPDGQWIAFFRMDHINKRDSLYIIHPDGTEERRFMLLPDEPGTDGVISWFDPGLEPSWVRAIALEGKATTTWGWLKRE